ncbi:serine/threonine-protein kinase STN8, chloroplastic-like [Macadamia integrifolia]|uniref:serine/threonine-protein kinase STN8, chloroplastic-like n=1 Tax=Macadamia integrifolia TaxID=60698 RepID=UPI001C4EDB11|nr:serine/threonine-protein kinase STN8, chloroplastic-like [Macadamia integrifolia]
MKDHNFPVNLESIMFRSVLQGLDAFERNALNIKQIMRQIITSLKKIHDTGIVHQDVKPANLVVTKKGKINLIDFGAAADLRVGKNYVPNRGLLDPDYCTPELYVLPEETPNPPPEPIAAFLSPILCLFGRRNLKRTELVVGDRLGEGNFGVVYLGAISVENRVLKEGKAPAMDGKFKEKVILKKIKGWD